MHSEAHLDSFDEVLVNFLRSLLGVDTHDRVGVFLEDVLHEAAILQQLLLDDWMLILGFMLQSAKDCLVPYVLTQDVVVLVGHGVEAPLLKFLIDQMVTHVERDHEAGLQVELLKHANLVNGGRRTLQDPAIRLAIRHLQALSKASNDVVIRYHVAILQHLTKLVCLLTFSPYEVFD